MRCTRSGRWLCAWKCANRILILGESYRNLVHKPIPHVVVLLARVDLGHLHIRVRHIGRSVRAILLQFHHHLLEGWNLLVGLNLNTIRNEYISFHIQHISGLGWGGVVLTLKLYGFEAIVTCNWNVSPGRGRSTLGNAWARCCCVWGLWCWPFDDGGRLLIAGGWVLRIEPKMGAESSMISGELERIHANGQEAKP